MLTSKKINKTLTKCQVIHIKCVNILRLQILITKVVHSTQIKHRSKSVVLKHFQVKASLCKMRDLHPTIKQVTIQSPLWANMYKAYTEMLEKKHIQQLHNMYLKIIRKLINDKYFQNNRLMRKLTLIIFVHFLDT